MKHFDCLQKDRNVKAPHFLKASAGTGKTFAIEHIVTRLIIEHDVPIQNILVVTFTKAATKELKERIRKRLEKTIESLENNKPSNILYLDVEEEQANLYLKRAYKALSLFDESEVYTIHGFCHRMLLDHGFEAGVVLSSQEDEDHYLKVIKEEIFSVFKTELTKEIFSPFQLELYFHSQSYDFEKIRKRLLNFVLENANFPEIITRKGIEDLAREVFFKLPPLNFEELKEGLIKLGQDYKGLLTKTKTLHKNFLAQLELVEVLSKKFSSEEFEKLLTLKPFFFELLSEENKKKSAKGVEISSDVGSTFRSLQNALASPLKKFLDPKTIELFLASLCQRRAKQALEAFDLVSFDDLLEKMHEALSNNYFRSEVQSRYSVAIIDEFQDTDALQWNIFHTLFSPQRGFPLHLIGDPKQSIYGFRSADLKVYLDAEKSFPSEQCFSLSTNHRSSQALIDSLNHLFSESRWLSRDGSLEYEQVFCSPKFLGEKSSLQGVHFTLFEEKKTSSQVPSKSLQEDQVFPWIAREIKELSKQKVDLSSIAILVSDRYQAEGLARSLKGFGISSIMKSSQPMAKTKAFEFFYILCKALYNPSDQRAHREALAHPFFGLNYTDLKHQETKYQKAVANLRFLSTIFVEKGLSKFWAHFIEKDFGSGPFLEHLIANYGEEPVLDLWQLFEILLAKAFSESLKLSDCLNLLESTAEKEEDEDDSLKKATSEAAHAAQIMTTHASKGLEFDIVFALGTSTKKKQYKTFVKIKEEGQRKIEVFQESQEKHLASIDAEEMEKARLLYVAWTRAKHKLYVPHFVFNQEPKSQNISSALDRYLEARFCASTKEQVLEVLKSLSEKGSITFEVFKPSGGEKSFPVHEEGGIKNLSARVFSKSYQLTPVSSFTSLSSHTASSIEFSPEEEEISMLSLPPSKQTGIFLHSLLERLFEKGIYRQGSLEAISQFVKSSVNCTLYEPWSEPIAKCFNDLLQTPIRLDKQKFCLKEISPENLTTEASFYYRDENFGLMKGIVDLEVQVFGKRYLFDWKTNFLGTDKKNYEQKGLLEAISNNEYDLQAHIYNQALLKSMQTLQNFGGLFFVFLRASHFGENPFVFQAPQLKSLEAAQ